MDEYREWQCLHAKIKRRNELEWARMPIKYKMNVRRNQLLVAEVLKNELSRIKFQASPFADRKEK